MQVVTEIDACRAAVRAIQRSGRKVGLVPTMGALHEGHVSLIRAAAESSHAVVVSIFVNPTQFGPNEDFRSYPRPLEADLEACENSAVAIVFAPDVTAMYGPAACTTIHVAKLTQGLCGPFRPGHFDGVATVVAKLFQIAPADAAFFGEKDYQQLAIVRRMVADLNIPIRIVGCPTIREADGLAMSSRNVYLSADERRRARSLSHALFAAQRSVSAGDRDAAALIREIRRALERAGVSSIDYVEAVDAGDLQPLSIIDRPARLCLAVRLGKTRLIDNVAVDAPSKDG